MHDLGNSGDTEYELENKNSDESSHNVSNKNVLDQMEPTVENVKSKLFRFIGLFYFFENLVLRPLGVMFKFLKFFWKGKGWLWGGGSI